MRITFCPLGSGSSGNSTFVGTSETGILIDAGFSGKAIQASLDSIGFDPKNLRAIFVTHEHSDHIKGAGILSRRFNVPIYATLGTWAGMGKEIGNIPTANVNYIYPNQYVHINDLCVKPFSIPHDASEPVGYSILSHKYKLTVATDLGHINDNIVENLRDSNVILLEANHDIDMLKTGPYPYILKKRILSEVGHLANIDTGIVLTEIMSDNIISIYLGHLSEDNNSPEVAFNTVKEIFNQNGIETDKYFKLHVASRHTASEATVLN